MKVNYPRRQRTGIMLAYPFDLKRLEKWHSFLVQRKYNGLRCVADISETDGTITLSSSTNLPITTVPHITEALQSMPPGVYDGELYIHQDFQRLTSLVNRGSTANGYQDVRFIVFDMKGCAPQWERLHRLATIIPTDDRQVIASAPFMLCSSIEQIDEILAPTMADGFEGLIIREPSAPYVEKRATTMMKLKPRSSDVYRIVGFQEEQSIHNERKGRLGAFLVADKDGRQFKVGSGMTAAERQQYWDCRDSIIGKLVHVKYPALTDRGVPWSPVFVAVIP